MWSKKLYLFKEKDQMKDKTELKKKKKTTWKALAVIMANEALATYRKSN